MFLIPFSHPRSTDIACDSSSSFLRTTFPPFALLPPFLHLLRVLFPTRALNYVYTNSLFPKSWNSISILRKKHNPFEKLSFFFQLYVKKKNFSSICNGWLLVKHLCVQWNKIMIRLFFPLPSASRVRRTTFSENLRYNARCVLNLLLRYSTGKKILHRDLVDRKIHRFFSPTGAICGRAGDARTRTTWGWYTLAYLNRGSSGGNLEIDLFSLPSRISIFVVSVVVLLVITPLSICLPGKTFFSLQNWIGNDI